MKHGMKMSLVKTKNEYITATINGRYYLARTNMIAEQIHSGNIIEKIDGCTKSEEFMRAEYAHQKMQAIMEMRNAHFAKKELKKDFKLNDDDIHAIEEDYYNGKIVREEYDEGYERKKNKLDRLNQTNKGNARAMSLESDNTKRFKYKFPLRLSKYINERFIALKNT